MNKTFTLSGQQMLEAVGFYLIEEGMITEEEIDNKTLMLEANDDGDTVVTIIGEFS